MKRKAENTELSNSIESKEITPGGGLEQMGRNDPSEIVSEEPPKEKKKFELTEKSTECSCDLDPVLLEYAKKLKETKFLRTPFLQNTSR